MNLIQVVFGDRLYKIDQPEASWHQPSPNDAAQCVICGETLTFCFSHGDYWNPSGIRCGCFRNDAGKREPVRITPLETKALP